MNRMKFDHGMQKIHEISALNEIFHETYVILANSETIWFYGSKLMLL